MSESVAPATTPRQSLPRQLATKLGTENIGLLLALVAVIVFFGVLSPRFLSMATFDSVAFQLPELGLLTLAMLMPIISGGINLAVTFTANLCGLTLAWVLHANGGPDASIYAFLLGSVLAVGVGAGSGFVMGPVIAYTGAHPILVSLSMMIFLRGLGEFLTRGADISGFPEFIQPLGHGYVFGVPIPLLILIAAVIVWHLLMTRTPLGFSNYMVGSNIEATRYSGIPTRRVITLIYVLSGAMSGIAGIIMLSRFNSVRVGHGESYVLITVLACFLGGVNPFGGFGKVVSVFLALIILQLLSSGLNLLGASQHLATAIWGIMLVGVMILRWVAGQLTFLRIRP
ncbi:ABC transporter permease [Mesorhizobium opportunistum]|uniref:ABC transporter permease n=1 Tax=Mesorhizobium opportunistum TaxID=593909 RepID=A0ABV1YET7_9HYPH|nr:MULTISPECIES: ABC transporter permease [Mesorhizobium]ESY65581.1 ABC transporter permease [Mesorhizobium sp. LNHC232B00]TJV13733.1 MAG: ABC transporter permease [Mesorhizobium sp.]TJV37556.1 MAG: ABC transporter permease [Mesorhizobium sp.]WJI35843.1 ABC transporter permease [Mesorhizobium opportunistum]